MSYSLLRPLLFALDAETAHRLTLGLLKTLQCSGLASAFMPRPAVCPRRVMGMVFPNPVGLAAGLDKNGEYIDALAALGFGFIEIGTVTPRAQPGNPRPRLFRIPQARAVINRMGFNNEGVDRLIENVRRARYRGVLGINIGKNFDTPIERAADDYLHCLRKVYTLASYVTVNISSPNTVNLRRLQESSELENLLAALKAEQARLADEHGRYVPLALKIAPDLDAAQVTAIAQLLHRHAIDAVIATNTTIAREGVAGLPHADETGGLSGAPLTARSTGIVRQLAAALEGSVPVIGVGGIMSGADAAQKIAAGASLVQLYTGLVYRGPQLVAECVDALCEKAGSG
ncbi:MAG: quinone-dependent dihydroorotate dehydrogenase [Burkholderiales bacterium]